MAPIIPHSLGGTHLPRNCFVLCAECHLTSPDCARAKYFVAFINRSSSQEHCLGTEQLFDDA
ncbi:HNH endonuclease [Pseudomonas sp. NPDC087358]|uniref:HNH endonuclease n=1 Tax=Pseudomonas sp. NPDC087358 TaxID=3364439 RepID=UPI00384DE0D5